MRQLSKMHAFLLAVVLASGCGDSEDAVPEAEEPALWTLNQTPSLTIGAVDGEPPYVFSRIRDLKLLPDARVVVADGGSQSLRIYSSQGVFERQMGGEGEGPGEFTYVAYLSIAAPDTIVAYDALTLRLTTFRATGDLVSTQPFLADTGMPERYIGTYSNGDHALAWINLVGDRDGTVVTPDLMQMARYGPDGQVLGPLGTMPGMRRLGSPVPFSPHFLAVMFEDSVFYTDGMGGVIHVLGAQDASPRSFSLPVERWSLDEAWLRLEQQVDADDVEDLRRIRNTPGTDSIPDFSDMLVDDEGLLWLKRYDPATDSHRLTRPRTGGVWLVADRAGQLVARVSIPDGFRPVDVNRNRVAGVARDELGVERVVVYELLRQ